MGVAGRPKKRPSCYEIFEEEMSAPEYFEKEVSVYEDDTVIDDYIEFLRAIHMNEWYQYMAERCSDIF